MINLSGRGIVVVFKTYVALTLAVATVLSPLSVSFLPILILIWYLYSWRWPVTPVISLLTDYFIFFATTLLFTQPVGPVFSGLVSVPVLLLINHSLEEVAQSQKYEAAKYPRYPTPVFITLLLILVAVLIVSLLLGSLSLLIACITLTCYFGIMGALILRQMPLKPVEEPLVEERMLAGTVRHLNIKLTSKTRIGGLLFIESPYDWLKVNPGVLSLREGGLGIQVSLTPALLGPSVIKLAGRTTDRWGLIQTSFELEPIRLFVIPRARYAAWLAKKYLAATKPGLIPLMSNITALKSIYGLRRGIEYYGSQLYQPGDSLKNIDWKHSLKYNQLITKEFAEFHGQSAVILINLSVGNAEEADELTYNIIVTAISLARENIPAALSAYDHEAVKITTQLLQPRQLVLRSLQVAQQMGTFINPTRYLNPPDVSRLRANMNRIGSGKSPAAKVLLQLLQLEYRNLSDHAMSHPATKALNEAFARVDKQSNIVVISQRNHDAEALAFNTFSFKKKGNSVITI